MKLKRKLIRISRLFSRVGASTVTEYAVIISIVSIAAVVLLSSIGKKTNNLLETMNSNMPQ
ncbi:MAG: hypothetical protein WCS70_02330 [Verrucomicrobiota bacterium]